MSRLRDFIIPPWGSKPRQEPQSQRIIQSTVTRKVTATDYVVESTPDSDSYCKGSSFSTSSVESMLKYASFTVGTVLVKNGRRYVVEGYSKRQTLKEI